MINYLQNEEFAFVDIQSTATVKDEVKCEMTPSPQPQEEVSWQNDENFEVFEEDIKSHLINKELEIKDETKPETSVDSKKKKSLVIFFLN